MSTFIHDSAREAPRKRVTVLQCDLDKRIALTRDRQRGEWTVDLSIPPSGDVVTWPKVGEEWYIEKISDRWTLNRRTELFNPALIYPAAQGDRVWYVPDGELIFIDKNGRLGLQGPQGLQGTRGFQGFQGVQGSVGAQGVQGSQGLQGSVGPQGVQGVTGSQGAQGVQGAVGSQGTQGVQGAIGSQGPQGFQGVQGSTGAQGPQGFQGNQGVQGNQGTQGTQGNQGTQGVQGAQGNTAPVGTVYMWLWDTAPSAAFLILDGSFFSKSAYPALDALFSSWGYPWGSTSTTVTLPDMRDRTAMGISATKLRATPGGTDTHNHDLSANGHAQITVSGNVVAIGRDSTVAWTDTQTTTGTGSTSGGNSRTTGAVLMGRTDNLTTLPPYSPVSFIIKAQ